MKIVNTKKHYLVKKDEEEDYEIKYEKCKKHFFDPERDYNYDPERDPYFESERFESDIKYGTADYDGFVPTWAIQWGKQRDF